MRYYFLIFLLFFPIISAAKWAKFEDASIKINIENINVSVNEDGTYEAEVEEEFEILKEAGREYVTRYTIAYDGDSQEIKLIEAKTISDGKEFKVEDKLIEDKPLASASQGFDQYRQILVAFPKIEIGNKFYVRYIKKVKKPNLDKFFDSFLIFSKENTILHNFHYKLASKIPLYFKENDPEDYLLVKNEKYSIEVDLKRPIIKYVVNEPTNGILSIKKVPWVLISTLDSWKEFGNKVGNENFSKIYDQKLPELFEQIAKEASQLENEIDKINYVTSALNDKIQYLSDRTSVNGRFAPRDLSLVSETLLGDCKDFSAATVAILTNLGFDAKFALIERGEGTEDFYPMPSMYAFNHAIVYVKAQSGKYYWIDPTNIQSMAGKIFPDIADSIALVLDKENSQLLETDAINPLEPSVDLVSSKKILSKNKILEEGTITMKNQLALSLTAAELYNSRESIKDKLYNDLSNSILEDKFKKRLEFPILKSRLVKDIAINYAFEKNNQLYSTNLGYALYLTSDYIIDYFIDIPSDTICDIFVGSPFTKHKKSIIKNVKVKNIKNLNQEMDSKWLYISRKLENKGKDLIIDFKMTLKKPMIYNEETYTSEFAALKEFLEQHFNRNSVVFSER